jgi:hypothetical protein
MRDRAFTREEAQRMADMIAQLPKLWKGKAV